jgi:hypothetical protein
MWQGSSIAHMIVGSGGGGDGDFLHSSEFYAEVM